ncbi:hypothetical protein DPMN_186821 [Dreissena polymorpha]|uniref:Uncharacterized protein n=1 Tax=Dreissena polymorpha TaxID=45954 RepID=A0A9D4DNJ0_DREPO|nr:hypothetical protein DPMN_186821 [Dreissena polymorpha]
MAKKIPYLRGAPGLVMGPCIVEIDRIVIREVQYQLEVNHCRSKDVIVKDNFWWVWPMWAACPRIDRIVIREWVWLMWAGRPRIDRIVINEAIVGAWSMWAGRPRFGNVAMHKVQYQLEVNRCRNKDIKVKGNFGWAWSMWAGHPRIGNGAMHNVQYQFEFEDFSAYSVGGDSGQDGRTDGRTDGGDNHNIPTLFKKRGDKK